MLFEISKMRIGTRLALGFGAVMICASGILLLALWRMTSLHANTEAIVSDRVASMKSAMEMRETGWLLALSLRKMITPTDATEGDRENKLLSQLVDRYTNAESSLQAHSDGIEAKDLVRAVLVGKESVFPVVEKIRQHARNGNYYDAGSILKNEFSPIHEKWTATLVALADQEERKMQETYAESKASFVNTRFSLLIIGVVTILFSFVIAIYTARSITKPLERAAGYAKTIASGDLTNVINVSGKDEASALAKSLDVMQDNLATMVRNIKASADAISVATGEIATGNADLSSRTESQAGALEETVSTIETLTSAVAQNARNATQASELVASASDIAFKGRQMVEQVVYTMGSIRKSSAKISEIIAVIDSIAFQTNILALNAAVEAARAGGEGKGFAVVASEVRSLAQRSANAAKEIKELIEDAVNKVEVGNRLVDEAGEAMNEIVSSVKNVADIMTGIAAASQQQSLGIEEVNRMVSDLDCITQQNAALVEQAAAVAESMKQQASVLGGAVNVFRLADTEMNSHESERSLANNSPLQIAQTTVG